MKIKNWRQIRNIRNKKNFGKKKFQENYITKDHLKLIGPSVLKYPPALVHSNCRWVFHLHIIICKNTLICVANKSCHSWSSTWQGDGYIAHNWSSNLLPCILIRGVAAPLLTMNGVSKALPISSQTFPCTEPLALLCPNYWITVWLKISLFLCSSWS